LGSLNVQIHCNIQAKLKQKPPEVEEALEGKCATGGSTGHHGRGAHHGLTVAATTGRGGRWWWWPVVSRALRFGLSVLRLGPQVFAFLGVFWASLQASFDPHSPNFFSLDSSQTFLPKSRLES